MYTLSGVSVAVGVGCAPALTVSRPGAAAAPDKGRVFFEPEAEIDKFQRKSTDFASRLALNVTPGQDKARDLYGAVAGFIINKANASEIIALINRGSPAAEACRSVMLGKIRGFSRSGDPELKAEGEAMTSIILEFIGSLQKHDDSPLVLPELTRDTVIIAKDLSPAAFLSLDVEKVKAVILELGRDSGHLSVVLRELGIPAVFGVQGATNIQDGTRLLVDGNNGVVVIEPAENTSRAIMEKADFYADYADDDPDIDVTIAGAVGAVKKIRADSSYARHGLGLLRSEFLFLSYEHEPTEEEMAEAFKRLFSAIRPDAPITARTFDFADDKNPLFRVRLDDAGPLKDYGAKVGSRLLRNELKALLEATAGRRIKVIFPLITRVSEARCLLKMTADCREELEQEHKPHGDYEVGFMIETPASVLCAPAFARGGCSMMIFGTSSLAEYAAAPRPVDTAFTPTLAKMIVIAAKAAHEAGIPAGVAGRFAPRVDLLPFFYKLGVTYYAVDGYQIGRLKNAAEQLSIDTGIAPAFDLNLYNEVMDIYTGKELSELINRLNLHA